MPLGQAIVAHGGAVSRNRLQDGIWSQYLGNRGWYGMHIVIGMPIVMLAIPRHQRQIAADDARRRGDTWLHGCCVLGRRQASAWITWGLADTCKPQRRRERCACCARTACAWSCSRATRRVLRDLLETEVGIDDVFAAACRRWRRKDDVVAMVGDGIDIESAHVVLMIKDNLLAGCVFWPCTLSRATVRHIYYNVHLGRVVQVVDTATRALPHRLVVASGHLSSDADNGVHAIRQITSVHVSEIQSIAAAATSSPSPVLLWHHFGEGDGFIGTISMSASGEQLLLLPEACVLAAYILTSSSSSSSSSLVSVFLVAGEYGGAKCLRSGQALVVWPLGRPPFGGQHDRLAATAGVCTSSDGERVPTTHILEQWNMTCVVIVLWSMRGWQPITQHHAGQCKLRVSHLDTRRQARAPVWPSFAVPAAVAELQRALCMFPATVSTAVEDAETDTPLSLLSFAASNASHAPALRALCLSSTATQSSASWTSTTTSSGHDCLTGPDRTFISEMRSRAFWHNLLKSSGELAKLEDAGARVVPLARAALAWYMLTVVLISGNDVAQLLLGAADDNNQGMILAHLLRHALLPALLVLGISNLAGWTSFRLLLNDNTLSANGLAARWRCWLLRILCVISMVLLNLLIALMSDCADVEFQLLRD
ncbi:hypothetical protein PTSG_02676 [Salpingoeca rosetta]|uniref:Transmembrane protein n=1 Tax=Salpingoeca rosetta (strain ATCC 50818 / BSB-021) TaxID=946362 RepID=F2U2Z5_SALR5|nr:uncharacterized protein PTSG_02676 [Salpingoeca rosetta]EGD81989.1 hypothetical protein PTSG_02676 [Salpingoeca rosetta]|eukprot:XP_004996172.1 hypothetical protein PTSG_02676 [Salpingoeca rosetta]